MSYLFLLFLNSAVLSASAKTDTPKIYCINGEVVSQFSDCKANPNFKPAIIEEKRIHCFDGGTANSFEECTGSNSAVPQELVQSKTENSVPIFRYSLVPFGGVAKRKNAPSTAPANPVCGGVGVAAPTCTTPTSSAGESYSGKGLMGSFDAESNQFQLKSDLLISDPVISGGSETVQARASASFLDVLRIHELLYRAYGNAEDFRLMAGLGRDWIISENLTLTPSVGYLTLSQDVQGLSHDSGHGLYVGFALALNWRRFEAIASAAYYILVRQNSDTSSDGSSVSLQGFCSLLNYQSVQMGPYLNIQAESLLHGSQAVYLLGWKAAL